MVAKFILAASTMIAAGPALAQTEAVLPAPAAIVADGVPALPARLQAATQPYLEFRTAQVLDWNPKTRGLLISTRFGNAAQLHEVAGPGMARTQISFEAEPIGSAAYAPGAGDVLLVTKDIGGGEFFQLYRLAEGRLTLLTDGKSRNTGATWSRDGKLVGYASTRRNGTDSDLYVMDPRDPKTDRLVAQRSGGGWRFADIAPGGAKALILNYISIQRSELHELDLATGQLTRLTNDKVPVNYGDAAYGPDGTIYVNGDRGSEYLRLGVLGRDGSFKPLGSEPKWDVEDFEVSDDGRFIAYALNEAGRSTVRLIEPKSGRLLGTAKLPAGVVSGLSIAPWGAVAMTLSSATAPADAFVLDPATMAVTRWTNSETGGLDAAKNRSAELVTVKSFDGTEVSGFLTTPDPAKFPGKRPLIVDIHGGPESQSRPGFLGRNNYLINELGVAIFYPNVRGSSGFGKTFVSMDNGPFKREDSVKDIAAYMDALAKRPEIDPARIAVTGGSYGGYMCYASAIAYGSRFKSALCTVAISNFVTFLENTQSYRRDLRRVEYGDERDPKQRAKLLEISPLTRIKELKLPLLVVTGANDPRVPQSEADQAVAAVRANGGTAWHLVAKDEGHGFRKKANTDYNFWTTVKFWEETLLK